MDIDELVLGLKDGECVPDGDTLAVPLASADFVTDALAEWLGKPVTEGHADADAEMSALFE